MKNFNYIINILLKDNNISAKIKGLSVSFSSIDQSVNKVSQTVNDVSTEITNNIGEVNTSVQGVSATVENTTKNISEKLKTVNFAALVDMTRNTAAAFDTLSISGRTFQQGMADLAAITGLTGKELDRLSKASRETGKSSGLGAAGAAEAFTLLASQIEYSTIGMEGLLTLQKETITLAQAGGLSMANAATAMAATINQFGFEASEANRVVNVLAAGSRLGAAEIDDLAASFKVAGATASAAGVSLESAAGALEVLSQSNLKGAEAGTALRNIILRMQTNLKVNFGETSLAQALDALKPKLQDVTFLAKNFGVSNVAAAQYLIANATAVDEMTAAVTGTNSAMEQAAIRTDTSAEKMKRMQAVIDDIKIGLFEASGGATAYVAAMGDSAILASQLVPVASALNKVMLLITTSAGRASVALAAKTAIENASIVVTKLVTVAQTALNAVLSANPVALVVLAIGALVTGLRLAYVHSESFRDIVDKCWAGIKKLAETIWNALVVAFEKVSSVITSIIGKLKSLFGIQSEAIPPTEDLAAANTKLAGSAIDAAGAMDIFADSLIGSGKAINTNLDTLGGVEQKISDLKAAQKTAMHEQAVALQKEIRLWENKLQLMQIAITKAVEGNIANTVSPKMEMPEIPPLEVPEVKIPLTIDAEELEKAMKRGIKQAELPNAQEIFEPYQIGIDAMASTLYSLSAILGENAGAWLQWGSNVLSSIAAAIPQIVALGNAQVASATAQVTGNTAAAASGAAASVAAIPLVGPLLAIAAISSVLAALASIPKPKRFASGGIVYGNTFAQVGEYPGAANNPEVIAPLNKLRDLIAPASGGPGEVVFHISGRDLKGILRKVERFDSRT
jgi:TP901 family phage tail tape measure protein